MSNNSTYLLHLFLLARALLDGVLARAGDLPAFFLLLVVEFLLERREEGGRPCHLELLGQGSRLLFCRLLEEGVHGHCGVYDEDEGGGLPSVPA